MNNEKLKKIAIKLEGIIPEIETVQEVHDTMIGYFKKNKDYFENFEPKDRLKIIIYIYSLKVSGATELGDKIIDNLYFAQLFKTERDYAKEECPTCNGRGTTTCDRCDGNGDEECYNCDGTGKVECSQCNGQGETECENCNGSGEDEEGGSCGVCGGSGDVSCDNCSGDGNTECDECEGNGEKTCYRCGGDGSETCPECDGDEEIQSETEFKYEISFICSWDSSLYNLLETSVNTIKPTMTEENYIKILSKGDKIIVLNVEENQDELIELIKPNMIYTIDLTTDVKLHSSPSMRFYTSTPIIPDNFI